MEFIIAFCAICAGYGTVGTIIVFAVSNERVLETVVRNGIWMFTNSILLLVVIALP